MRCNWVITIRENLLCCVHFIFFSTLVEQKLKNKGEFMGISAVRKLTRKDTHKGGYSMKKMAVVVGMLLLIPFYSNASLPSLGFTSIGIEPIGCGEVPQVLGEVSISIEGGAPPFTYSLSGLGAVTTESRFILFPSIAAATYVVTVTDSTDPDVQAITATITVGGPELLGVSNIAIDNPDCGTPDGTITFTTNGGRDPITFALNGVPHGSSGTFVGLTPGVYSIGISTVDGCASSVYSIPLTGPEPLLVQPSSSPVTCFGGSNGEIVIQTIQGGTSPYRIGIDNGPLRPFPTDGTPVTFSNLLAGTHFLTVVDEIDCRTDIDLPLVGSPAQLVAATTVKGVTCNGGSDGAITITGLSGGVPPLRFAFNGDGLRPFTAPVTFSNLSAGTNIITIADSQSCFVNQPVVVPQQTDFVITNVVSNPVSASGRSDGSLFIQTTPGFVGVEYSINGGVTFQPSPEFRGLSAGTYAVQARVVTLTGTLCAVRRVTIGAPLAFTFTVTSTGCSPATLTLAAVGGVSPYRYSIDNGTTFQSSPVFTGLAAGLYDVVVVDAAGTTVRQAVRVGRVIPPTGNPLTDFIISKYCQNCVVIAPAP